MAAPRRVGRWSFRSFAPGQAIAGARTVVLKDSGHFMMVERPDETLDALKSHV